MATIPIGGGRASRRAAAPATLPPIWRCCRPRSSSSSSISAACCGRCGCPSPARKLLPKLDFVGLAQYQRLFANERFVVSVENIVIFGVLFIVGRLVLGFLLAVFIDQRVRGEALFRTIFLYPLLR